MIGHIRALLHFYLYSSLHIALAAYAITSFTYSSVDLDVDIPYALFVAVSTLLLYSLHRIIGIKKSASYSTQGRFAIIIRYKSHLIGYSVLSAIYCGYTYISFDIERQLLLIIPILISLGYSLPVFWGRRRLRDFHWIKIFLIALCWAVITVSIPLFEAGSSYNTIASLSLERLLYIFVITIPFDIRDRKVDQVTNVRTLATVLSNKILKIMSLSLLLLASIIAATQISYPLILALVVTYLISAILIVMADENKSDYYYTGLIDGTMLLPMMIYYLYL